MEKAPGVELASVWPGLLGKKRPELVTQIIQLQKRFTASPFPGIGSLYYAEDLDDGIPTILVETGSAKTASTAKKFVIGPINDHHWFDSGRGDVECDRGPCTFIILDHIVTPLIPPRVKYRRLLGSAGPP